MLTQQTIEKINGMKLVGLAQALEQQLASDEYARLSFEERVSFLIEQRKLKRRLDAAKLRYQASLEDVDFKHPRGLDRQQVLSLGQCGWIRNRHNLVITGPTGIGKSYLACAFVERACRRGFSASYLRLPRLLQHLAVARGDGSYERVLARLAKLDLLAIDDWLLAPLRDGERRDLIEVIEDRSERAATLIASQLPSKNWHAVIGDPNLADSICDRLLHNAHRIELKGPSIRNTRTDSKPGAQPKP
jgi:DNA replication protein DnaC